MQWRESKLGRLAALLVALALGGIALWIYATTWAPSREKYPIQGVEVSAEQGRIIWPTLAARDADFAYLLATSGAHSRDAQFAVNWEGSAAAGIRHGAVHRWSFCSDGNTQADNFVTTVPRTGDALPAVLELAFSPDCTARPPRQALVARLKTFLAIAETHTGQPMMIKIAKQVERTYHVSAAIPRPLWEERDFVPPDYAARPWRVWQASSIRRVDGAEAPLDWDVVAP